MALLSAPLSALAFDTGHHVDLTAAVLREQEFQATSSKAVQVANWLTDYYTVSPTSRELLHGQLEKLHFDNLYDTHAVADYWGWLVSNALDSVTDAAESDDPVCALAVTGLFLHAVQDFYAHSNWVETHPRAPGAPYRRETWLATRGAGAGRLSSGAYPPYPSPPPPDALEHGGYTAGLNKDSHIRPLWDEAYVFAYVGSHEALDALGERAEQVNPGFWQKVKTYEVVGAEQKRLDFDVEAALNMSMWVKGKGADGHWKGDESGSARYLSKFSAEWTPARGSSFLARVKKERVHEKLTAHLYSGEPAPDLPEFRSFDGRRTVVIVRTTEVAEIRDGEDRIDPGGKADLYSIVDVGVQRYRDRGVRNKRNYTNPWAVLHFADADETEIPIRIQVWDEDASVRGRIDECDINPASGAKQLSFLLHLTDGCLTGDVEGCHGAPENAVEVAGAKPDKKRVGIKFYVATLELENP